MNILNAFFFLAILVYRYDFTPWVIGNGSAPRASGFIEMRYATTTGTSLLDAVYDFQVTGVARTDPSVPYIPAITFTKADAISSWGGIGWDEKEISPYSDFGFVSPHLDLDFPLPNWGQHYAVTSFNVYQILTTWPADFIDTEPRTYGDWKFTRSREVPETGSTLLYLGLGLIVLGTTQVWRKA